MLRGNTKSAISGTGISMALVVLLCRIREQAKMEASLCKIESVCWFSSVKEWGNYSIGYVVE